MTQVLRVLLVDDSSIEETSAIQELKEDCPQLQIEEIRDAPRFFQAMAIEEFDLVITADRLSWSSGLAILDRVKQRHPHCPVIMIVHPDRQSLAVEAMKLGLDDYVLRGSNRRLRLSIAIQVALKRAEIQQQVKQSLDSSRREQTALERANRKLEEFAYSISHDLREPIRSIQIITQLVLAEHATGLDPAGLDLMQRIISNTGRADQLIETLLAYSRLNHATLTLQPIRLRALLNEVVSQFQPALQQRQAQISLEEPIADVLGNPVILNQVLTNLVSNAIKFVAPGVQPQIRIGTEPQAHRVRLWVKDNGIGIAPAAQRRIFNPFERLHDQATYPGSGLGLAIVCNGVQHLGGRVGVESQPGQGSRFWIELPALPQLAD